VRLVPPKDVRLDLGFQTISRGGGAIHQYRLQLRVTNTGSERLDDYWIELQFPKAVINRSDILGAVKTRETETHTFLRATRNDVGRDLYPSDSIDAMPIDYHMYHDLYFDGSVLSLPVIASVGAPGMNKTTVERPFRELQEFWPWRTRNTWQSWRAECLADGIGGEAKTHTSFQTWAAKI
jgi:hypothetical protein